MQTKLLQINPFSKEQKGARRKKRGKKLKYLNMVNDHA